MEECTQELATDPLGHDTTTVRRSSYPKRIALASKYATNVTAITGAVRPDQMVRPDQIDRRFPRLPSDIRPTLTGER
jgi:hypothetical protein